MKNTFLQIGLGSMGKRRIRNLLANDIKCDQIFGFDIAKGARDMAAKEHGIKTFNDFAQAVKLIDPDVYIISTPADKHHQYFLYAANRKKHFFVETSSHDKGYNQLLPLLDGSFIAAPSCTFRSLPAIKKIQEIVDSGTIGKILSFQYYLGQYLPDWHPWEDYRKVYFAQKETGGCREMLPFELNWITNMLQSKVKTICGLTRKISDLDMPADDIYSAIIEFENDVIGTLTIDLLARTPLRTLRLIGTDGVLDWEWLNYKINIFNTATKKWKTINLKKGKSTKGYVSTDEMYEEEMKYFIGAINGKVEYPFTFEGNLHLLKALYALEKSDRTGTKIAI